MTACVNKKHTRRVALAISASLVGALSLGAAAPAVAFAANDGIQTMDASKQQSIFDAKVTDAITTNNDEVTFNADGSMSVVASAEGIRGVYATELTVAGTPIKLSKQAWEDGDFTINFYRKGDITYKSDGITPTRVNSGVATVVPKAVGDYTAVITFNSGAYSGCKKAYDFRITPAEIGDVTVVNTETGDDTFTYDATPQIDNAQILVDGKKVNLGAFDVEWYAIGDVSAGANKVLTRNAKNAGDYAVKLTGRTGTIYAGSTDWGYFTVDQLNLAASDVVINDMEIADLKTYGIPSKVTPPVASVNGKSAVCSELTATFVSSTTGTVDEPGEYTFKVAPTDPDNANIINSADSVKFNAVEKMLSASSFLYNGSPMTNVGPIDARDSSYNTGLIRVAGLDGQLLPADAYTITVTDRDGRPVNDTNLATSGLYTVTVEINMDYSQFKYGGKKVVEVLIVNGYVNTADVYFTYDGVVGGNTASDTYDGTNLLDKLAVTVFDDLGVELSAEDYDVVVTDAAGNVVTEAVDAGTYTVTVSSDDYVMADETFTLTVEPVTVTEVRVSNLTAFGEREFYPYTGSDIAVELEYKDADGSWKPLPADTYELVFQYEDELHGGDYSVVESVKEVGYYKVYAHQAEKVKNYRLQAASGDKGFIPVSNVWVGENDEGKEEKISGLIEVSDQKVFADVENTFWGAQEIFDAVDLGYMSGYKGTTFFGPLDHLTRAQAAVVLYNMGTGRSVPETSTLHVSWVERGLAFPDAEQWYAAELGWATQVGVVEGYPDGNYGGSDEITREQFAIMLRNYAAAKGEDVTVDDVDAALEGVKDAGTISDWAREAVAWAVENGVMGAEGYVYAGDPIERAGAAIMVTRYQPQELDKDDYLVGNVK